MTEEKAQFALMLEEAKKNITQDLIVQRDDAISEVKQYIALSLFDLKKQVVHLDELKADIKRLRRKKILSRFFHAMYSSIIIMLIVLNGIDNKKTLVLVADNNQRMETLEMGLMNLF